ncbi:VOC family protein [Microbulbifer thermotolerans]|uniref:VOC family protein n=1 Tax=Microbulbifer thermotolerans TaxID=252514 RepID=UPI00224B9089|nr:VOC family protein [Microbulbifer thermotolerans]MCX2781020.1 VOC family protein [Microbulbifer thermotolerans]MCX2804585.1 VOC family protein [Microbulbifer thermotolerans]
MEFLINIDVDDLPRAIDFYRSAFGLRPGRSFGASGMEMLGGNAPLYLLAKAPGSQASEGQRRNYRRHWTPVHLDMVVDDVEAAVDRAVAAGAKLEGEIRVNSWGAIATLSDPFGHGFCLLEFRGRGYDALAQEPSGQGTSD